jgi:protein PsiE|tara:strand:+ start:189 stop:578 length:390 start_codon:yes stop_codon:yes gene_type:complete
MDLNKIIRFIQVFAVLVIFIGSVIGFVYEILHMLEIKKIQLADLLLLFIYVEVMGMIRVYLLQEEIRITYPLIIAITAISRLIILQKKDLDPAILIYESVAILILAFAIIVLKMRYINFFKEDKKNEKN